MDQSLNYISIKCTTCNGTGEEEQNGVIACRYCGGNGSLDIEDRRCGYCGGHSEVQNGMGDWVVCQHCKGSGEDRSDSVWRLELINNVSNARVFCKGNIGAMLAPPEPLASEILYKLNLIDQSARVKELEAKLKELADYSNEVILYKSKLLQHMKLGSSFYDEADHDFTNLRKSIEETRKLLTT